VVAIPHPDALSSCHVAVAPRRHVATFYDLDVQEQRMVWNALGELRDRIMASLNVEGFDVGFADAGDGGADHAFVHLIPRIPGESVDLPRGPEWVDLGLPEPEPPKSGSPGLESQ
jgi:diadenosine tetraphosphate (Ap4A) HIT family hydrolase